MVAAAYDCLTWLRIDSWCCVHHNMHEDAVEAASESGLSDKQHVMGAQSTAWSSCGLKAQENQQYLSSATSFLPTEPRRHTSASIFNMPHLPPSPKSRPSRPRPRSSNHSVSAPLLSQADAQSAVDSLVEGTSTATATLPRWASNEPEAENSACGTAALLMLDYLLICNLSAVLTAAVMLIPTLLGFVTLYVFNREPFASHTGTSSKVLLAGAVGGAILSIAFTTIAWSFDKLEKRYEAANEIYAATDLRPPWLDVREPRRLVQRYRHEVFAGCVFVGTLVCGIFGPAIGTLILVKHGAMDGGLTVIDAMLCGGVGTGEIAAVVLVFWMSAQLAESSEWGGGYMV